MSALDKLHDLETTIEMQLGILDDMMKHTRSKSEFEALKGLSSVIAIWLERLKDIDTALRKSPQEILETTSEK
jgi:hypothetical protein